MSFSYIVVPKRLYSLNSPHKPSTIVLYRWHSTLLNQIVYFNSTKTIIKTFFCHNLLFFPVRQNFFEQNFKF